MASIKIPDTYFCGRKEKDALGFITPDGTDSAAKKRKDTVIHWTRGYSGNSEMKLDDPKHFFSFKNKPTSGFELAHCVSRCRTNNKLFQVKDPRGFEIQISAENLADICVEGGINNGHFIGSYVYGREGRDNVLLPIGSPIFQEAFALTKAVKAGKISLRDLNIGQKVELLYQNQQVECLYVGYQYRASTEIEYHYDHSNKLHWGHSRSWNTWRDTLRKPRHMFVNLKKNPNSWQRVIDPTSPHVLRIIEEKYKTKDETIKALAAVTGPVIEPQRVPEYVKCRPYKSAPDTLNLFTLDKAVAEKAIADRADYLKNFQPVEIQPK
jgi:hypothetical protein